MYVYRIQYTCKTNLHNIFLSANSYGKGGQSHGHVRLNAFFFIDVLSRKGVNKKNQLFRGHVT